MHVGGEEFRIVAGDTRPPLECPHDYAPAARHRQLHPARRFRTRHRVEVRSGKVRLNLNGERFLACPG